MPRTAKYSPQQLEALVLAAAVKAIEESSLLDFTMAAVSKESGLSMGSIYKFVQSKEDVLAALATTMMRQHRKAFGEILGLQLTMPERLICNTLLSPHKLHSFSFGVHLEMLISNEAIIQKASSRWTEELFRIEASSESLFRDVFMQSFKNGELLISPKELDKTLELVLVGVWSMTVGFFQIAYQRHVRPASDCAVPLPFPLAIDHPLVENTGRLINTYPWKVPLDEGGIKKAAQLLDERGYR